MSVKIAIEQVGADPSGGCSNSLRQTFDADVDRAIESIEPVEVDRHRQAAAAGDVRVLGVERNPKVFVAGTDNQPIEEVVSRKVPHVANPDDVTAVGGNVEQNLRIASETRPAVVVAVVERDDRHAVRGKGRPRRMDFDFVRSAVDRVRLGSRAEITQARASLVEEFHVFIRPQRQDLHLEDLVAEHHEVVRLHVLPVLQADSLAPRIVISQDSVRFGDGAQRVPRDGPSGGVENVDYGIEGRAEAAGKNFDRQPVALAGVKRDVVDVRTTRGNAGTQRVKRERFFQRWRWAPGYAAPRRECRSARVRQIRDKELDS